MTTIITYEELGLLARPISTERDMAEALIMEAQREDIRRRLGDELYIQLVKDIPDERFKVLLDGGVVGGRIITGVKTALAYYALARIVRDGNIQASTYGAVVKDDQYSMDAEASERQRQYRELFAIADGYMSEVMDFLSCNRVEFPEFHPCEVNRTSNRMKIRVINKI